MDVDELHFYNPREETETWHNRLPHWQQGQAAYFVTFRLADSVPHSLLNRWESERAAWLAHHPEPWAPETAADYHGRFSGAMEHWLDAGHGSCVLRDPCCSRVMKDALQHFDGTRCCHISWVVMPNHIHALFVLSIGEVLGDLVHSWKSFTSKEINSLLDRIGVLWQKDCFDRLVRNGQHLDNSIRYIRRNPAKARLCEDGYTLYESDFARSVT